MKCLKLSSVDDANTIIDFSFTEYQMGNEVLPITACRGRILAENITSPVNVPEYRRSIVDGYAIRREDIDNAPGALETVLQLAGRTEMGKISDLRINRGYAAYVPTGGMVPDGADRVVMQEYVSEQEQRIYIDPLAPEGINFIEIGGDIPKDSLVLISGRRIRTQEIGALAAVGRRTVRVLLKPRISILCTGDELVPWDEEVEPGMIRDMNTITLRMIAEEMGCTVVRSDLVPDDFEKIRTAVQLALLDSDILVISGGSSVGEKDITAEVLESIEENSVMLHGIRIKPGKPTIVAKIQGKPVFGLPGHPVAALNIFRIFVSRALNRIQQQPDPIQRIIRVVCAKAFRTDALRDTFQMVRLTGTHASPQFEKVDGESGMITLLTKADGYILVPAARNQVRQGEEFDMIVLD